MPKSFAKSGISAKLCCYLHWEIGVDLIIHLHSRVRSGGSVEKSLDLEI